MSGWDNLSSITIILGLVIYKHFIMLE